MLIHTRRTLLGRAGLHRIFSSLNTQLQTNQIKRLPSLSSVLNMFIKGDVCTPGTYMLYTTLPQWKKKREKDHFVNFPVHQNQNRLKTRIQTAFLKL